MLKLEVEFSPHEPVHAVLAPATSGVQVGDQVVAQSLRGPLLAKVVRVDSDYQPSGEPEILRLADEADLKKAYQQRLTAVAALELARSKALDRGLPMTFLSAFFTIDHQRLVLFFFAEERVDFRTLLRDITAVYPQRLELFQVKERDRSKLLGAIGNCGRVCCCSSWIREFSPVTVKMAKDQGLASAPSGISGVCGKLRCCLRYEHEAYNLSRQELPGVGQEVETPEGRAKVVAVNPMLRLLTVRLPSGQLTDIPVGRAGAKQGGKKCRSCSSRSQGEESAC